MTDARFWLFVCFGTLSISCSHILAPWSKIPSISARRPRSRRAGRTSRTRRTARRRRRRRWTRPRCPAEARRPRRRRWSRRETSRLRRRRSRSALWRLVIRRRRKQRRWRRIWTAGRGSFCLKFFVKPDDNAELSRERFRRVFSLLASLLMLKIYVTYLTIAA